MELRKLNYDFTVCKVRDYSLVNFGAEYFFIGKTDEENSLVCITSDVPANVIERDDGWKAFRIQGVLDFSLVGIMAKLATLLAYNGISIFAVSTFNTDYVLIKNENYERALTILETAGYAIVGEEAVPSEDNSESSMVCDGEYIKKRLVRIVEKSLDNIALKHRKSYFKKFINALESGDFSESDFDCYSFSLIKYYENSERKTLTFFVDEYDCSILLSGLDNKERVLIEDNYIDWHWDSGFEEPLAQREIENRIKIVAEFFADEEVFLVIEKF